MTHAWCSDPSRDAALRAAEDAAVADRPTLPDHRELPAAVEHLRSLCHGHFQEFEELVEIVGRINARLEWVEAMIPKSVSATSAPDHENKGDGMAVTECRSEQTKGDEMSQGMRTERVVLEFEIERGSPPSEWPWSYILSRSDALKMRPGESVRVVEDFFSSVDERTYVDTIACDEERDFANRILDERDAAIRERDELRGELERANHNHKGYRNTARARVADLEAQLESVADRAAAAETALHAAAKIAPHANDDGGSNHAAQAASGGGEGEPVAWMCEWTDHVGLHHTKTDAEDEAAGDIVPQPLYRSPPQPRGWLTNEERVLVQSWERHYTRGAHYHINDIAAEMGKRAEVCRSLLARSSPPEVVKPTLNLAASPTYIDVSQHRDAEWIAAIAASGVAVKAVG
jgi:hypothetical protein